MNVTVMAHWQLCAAGGHILAFNAAPQVLNLAHCHMLSTLVGVVETMPNLRDVELTDTGIGDADLRLLASSCHHIQCAMAARCPVNAP